MFEPPKGPLVLHDPRRSAAETDAMAEALAAEYDVTKAAAHAALTFDFGVDEAAAAETTTGGTASLPAADATVSSSAIVPTGGGTALDTLAAAATSPASSLAAGDSTTAVLNSRIPSLGAAVVVAAELAPVFFLPVALLTQLRDATTAGRVDEIVSGLEEAVEHAREMPHLCDGSCRGCHSNQFALIPVAPSTLEAITYALNSSDADADDRDLERLERLAPCPECLAVIGELSLGGGAFDSSCVFQASDADQTLTSHYVLSKIGLRYFRLGSHGTPFRSRGAPERAIFCMMCVCL